MRGKSLLQDRIGNRWTTTIWVAVVILFFMPKKMQRIVPPQLVALLVGTLVSIILLSDADIRRIGEIPTGLPATMTTGVIFDSKI